MLAEVMCVLCESENLDVIELEENKENEECWRDAV